VDILKRLYYYRDPVLLVKVFATAIEISAKIYFHGGKKLFSPEDSSAPNKTKKYAKEKVIKYCNFCLYLRRWLGFNDTCFTCAALIHAVLKWAGIGSRVNFGTAKINNKLIGHCWVTVEGEKIDSPYHLIASYA
jgi:hypothetical protein